MDALVQIRPRATGGHRPEVDPACAGCPQLGLLRALRRAGLDAAGALGCEPPTGGAIASGAVLLAGAREVLAGAPALLARARTSGAALVVADRTAAPRSAARLEALLASAGALVHRVDPADLAAVEGAVERAVDPRTVLLALAPCHLRARRAAAFAIAPSRCNRCGACLSLGCPAIADPGGEALAIDPGSCSGCGLCAPLCRSRAIALPPATTASSRSSRA
ncbi:MAG TPA: 4Fe-4S binding protein [Anaeromyxobacteraceae bacterium]|nr:4Fe-4S binding protein [Anaeromyxobacteraceae bacterium]